MGSILFPAFKNIDCDQKGFRKMNKQSLLKNKKSVHGIKNKNKSSDSLRNKNLLVIIDGFLAIVWNRMGYFEKTLTN